MIRRILMTGIAIRIIFMVKNVSIPIFPIRMAAFARQVGVMIFWLIRKVTGLAFRNPPMVIANLFPGFNIRVAEKTLVSIDSVNFVRIDGWIV